MGVQYLKLVWSVVTSLRRRLCSILLHCIIQALQSRCHMAHSITGVSASLQCGFIQPHSHLTCGCTLCMQLLKIS